MRQIKVIFLAADNQDPQWQSSFASVFGDKHDWSRYDPSKPAGPQFATVEVVVDTGGQNMTPALVAAAKKCKLWHILTVGYDRFDMGTMRKAGIPVTTVPGSTTSPGLANCAIMFMLQIVTKYNEAQKTLKAVQMYTPMGDELEGKILGLLGFGASARALAPLAKAFGMRLMIIEPGPVEQGLLEEYKPVFVGKPDAMDKVIAEADFVSLHLPLNPETQGIMDARRIGNETHSKLHQYRSRRSGRSGGIVQGLA